MIPHVCLFQQYGRSSLEMVLKSILGVESPLVKSEDYPPEFFDSKWFHDWLALCVSGKY